MLDFGKWYKDKTTGYEYFVAYYAYGNDIELISKDGNVISKSDNFFDLCNDAGIKLENLCEEN